MGKSGYKGTYSKSYGSGGGGGGGGSKDGKGWNKGYESQSSGWKGKHTKGDEWAQVESVTHNEGAAAEERTGRIQ